MSEIPKQAEQSPETYFDTDRFKACKGLIEQMSEKQSQVEDLRAQLSEAKRKRDSLKKERKTAKVEAELSGEDSGGPDTEDIAEIEDQISDLSDRLETKKAAIDRLKRDLEAAREKKRAELQRIATETENALFDQAVTAFQRFVSAVEDLKRWQQQLPDGFSPSKISLNTTDLYNRYRPKLPQFIDEARTNGYVIFPSDRNE